MDVRQLVALDLNLLVHLHVLLEERHVSRAAERLASSQPALSRSLSKLRLHFGDPLLVRSGNGLVLTERAKGISLEVVDILRKVEGLAQGAAFHPSQARGTIRFAAPDVIALMLVPQFLARMGGVAPWLDLEVVRWQSDWRSQLERGEIDLTIGFPKGDEAGVFAKSLMEHQYAVVLRKGHPALRKKWTPEVYSSLPHVLVTALGHGASSIDEALAARGLTRRIHARIPYPLLAPMLAANSDVVVTTVRFLALQLAPSADLVIKKPPLALPPVTIPMVWHERSHGDPRHRWVREQIASVAASISPRLLRW